MTLRQNSVTYREMYRFPVAIMGTEVVLRVGAVGVVSMPDSLGARVQSLLQPAQHAGPVFADPDTGRWVFLTAGIPTCDPAYGSLLSEAGVRIVEWGEQVALPLLSESSKPTSDERRWLWPPGYELPQPGPFVAELLGAIHRFGHRGDLRGRALAG
ncbi:hypothetical protein [Nocardia lijiangensis]|uniref:hypothetical protein n=1 Tax=Nocardia lijiangensis TaxID=299618 RepID=UPI000AD2C40D|nr:hypothetical protein [Nocardia lijiangensis]